MARRTAAAAAGAVCCCLLLSVYLAFFRHPPASVILAAQKGDAGQSVALKQGKEYSVSEIAEAVWSKWIADTKYVSVGSLYDSCDAPDRTMIGKTILLPDEASGGVITRLHLNASFDEEIQYGEFSVNIKYNGRHLYENHFDLCTYDKDEPEPMIHCPLRKGPYVLVKSFQVPSYLPKGRYQATGWVTNEEKKTVVCGYTDLTI